MKARGLQAVVGVRAEPYRACVRINMACRCERHCMCAGGVRLCVCNAAGRQGVGAAYVCVCAEVPPCVWDPGRWWWCMRMCHTPWGRVGTGLMDIYADDLQWTFAYVCNT